MKSRIVSVSLVLFITTILFISSNVPAGALDDWQKGDEKNYTGGHTFDEEWWKAEYTNKTKDGYNLTSSIFYMNSHNVSAFLIAINRTENETNVGTYPYQLFGLHYYSPEGQEVFIGAIFAFLLGYNNTYEPEKGIPNPEHENVSFIIPFGVGSLLKDNYVPVTESSITRHSDTHYVFKIRYKNLYALVTQNPWWSAILKTGWIMRFSELTFKYEIKLDVENGEVRVETYYHIGQVTKLWLVIAGLPIPVDVSKFPDTLGIAAVHYGATFTSYSRVIGAGSGNEIETGITKPVDEDLVLEENNERVFKIGFRGVYDVLDETKKPPKTIHKDQNALNIILKARPLDKLFVWNQLQLSADLMSIMAYGISDTVQDEYESPRDLKQKAIFNYHKQNFWYAVAFPEWDGYRIEHDPVYTAYTNFSIPPEKESKKDEERSLCGSAMIGLIATTACVCAVGISRKRRK